MNKLIWIAGLLCLACQPNKTEEAKKLEKEVFAIHDEVMPKISKVLQLRKQIYAAADSSTGPAKGSLQQISYALTKADMDMSEWMHQYKEPGYSSDTAISYLLSQKEKISIVSKEINEGIEAALKVTRP